MATQILPSERLHYERFKETDLAQQTSFRAGQLVESSRASSVQIEKALTAAQTERCSNISSKINQHLPVMQQQFHQGIKEAYMDCYQVTRKHWRNTKAIIR